MIKVCTAAQMRTIDRLAEELGSVPSIVLMENAAISCVGEILKTDKIKSAAIFCGKGNNGGDGLAIARHLKAKGLNVCVYLVCGSDFYGDALINYEIISKLGITIIELDDTDFLGMQIKNFDIIVDAIFGTGIHGEITDLARDVINEINNNSKYTLSVDIPSGINADTGEICGICIKADKTVTFAAYKRGLLLFPGADFCGEIVVKDISIPEYIINGQNININIIDKKFVDKIIPSRVRNSHKGDYGKVLIIGGSEGLSGAVCLAANACVRSGAGLVTVAVPSSINTIIETKLTEPMSLPLPDLDGKLDKSSIDILKNIINNFDSCLFGPGIGRSDDIVQILTELLKVSKIPMIIDADGLYALSQNPAMLDSCNCSLILTPHEMEMSRISGFGIDYIGDNRIEVSHEYSTQNGITLILKGPHTIVTSPCGEQYINISGNCGMATGGSGDVLAGIISAFVARGISDVHASCIGVYTHGIAGDIAALEKGYDSLIPSDIINHIPNALNLPVE